MKEAPGDVEVDGEIVNVNKVEGALRTIGVALRDTKGQFRDLDDVFLEISAKWNDLDINTQRYIATIAAGSRQQSRFIAMMDNYDRTVELVDAAYNSAGASQEQYEKTLDSLQSKLNMLANAWQEFTTGIANSNLVKGGVDLLTNILTTINNLTDGFGDWGSSISKVSILLASLAAGGAIVKNIGKTFAPNLVAQLTGKINGEAANKVNKAGSFLGTRIINSINNSINKDKSFVGTLGNKIDDGIDGFKGKIADFNKAFKSLFENNVFEGINGNQLSDTLNDSLSKYLDLQEKINDLNFETSYNNEEKIRFYETTVHHVNELTNSLKLNGASVKLLTEDYDSYFHLLSLGLTQQQVEILLSDKAAKEDIQEALAKNELTKEKLKEIATNRGLLQSQNALLGKGKNYINLLFSTSKATRTAAAGALGLGKAGAGAAGGMTKLGAALVSTPWGWIALAIAAVAAALVATGIAAHHNSIEYKLEQAREATERAKEEAQELKTVYNDLLSKQTEYNSTLQNIENLTEGTKEWKDAITAANQEVLNLVANYKELAPYISKTQDGLLTIDEKGWEDFLQEAEKASSDALGRTYVSQINELQLEKQLDYKNFEKEIQKVFNQIKVGTKIPNAGSSNLYTWEGRANNILKNWEEFTEKNSNVYNGEEFSILRADLLKAVEGYNTNVYTSSEQLSGYFTALVESLGVAIEGVDNFAASLEFNNNEAEVSKIQNRLKYYKWWNANDSTSRLTLRNIAKKNNIDISETYDDGFDGIFGSDVRQSLRIIYADFTNQTVEDVQTLLKNKELSYDDIANSIAQQEVLNNYEHQITELAEYLQQTNLDTANFITDAFANETANLFDNKYTDDLSKIVELVSTGETDESDNDIKETQINRDKLSQYLKENNLGDIATLAEKYNKTEEEIISHFQDIVKQLQDLYRTNVKNFLVTFRGTGALEGATTEQTYDLIDSLGAEKLQELTELINLLKTDLEEGTVLFNTAANQLLSVYASGTKEDIAAVTNLVHGINWQSTIDSAYKLERAINSNNVAVKEFAAQMLLASEQTYSISNQFNELFGSEAYTELSESIEDLVEENGELTARNVEEMAEGCEDLNKILKQDIVSADALAKAMTGLSKDELSLSGLTNRTWDFLNSLSSVNSLINKVHDNIENFDEGIDTGEGMDFLVERYEKIQEYVDNMEFGNDQVMGSLEYIFGKDIFEGLSGDTLIAEIEARTKSLKEWTAGDGYGFWQDVGNGVINIPGIQSSLDENKNVVLEIAGMTTNEVVQAIMSGAEMTEEAAQMFLTNYISHSADIRQALKENDIAAAIENTFKSEKAFNLNGENLFIYSREEIENMASLVGLTYDEFLTKAQEYNNSIKIADWFTDNGVAKIGDELKAELDEVYNGLGSKSTKEKLDYLGIDYELNDFRNTNQQFNGIFVNLDELIAKYQELGLTIEQTYDEIDRMAAEKINREENLKFTATVAIGVDKEGKTITDTVYADTREGLELAIEQAKSSEKMKQWATTFAESIKLAFGEDGLSIGFAGTADDAVTKAEEARNAAQDFLDKNLNVFKYKNDLSAAEKQLNNFIKQNRTITLGYQVVQTGSTTSYNTKGQKWDLNNDGKVSNQAEAMLLSQASGTSEGGIPKTGPALTGEEGFEIAYHNGEAFILGANGPEIVNLEKGTQVFNHEQSKQIIRRSKIKSFGSSFVNGTIPSYATGTWGDEAKKEVEEAKKNSSSSSSSDNSKDPYESALDVYYNFISRLAKLNNDLDDLINERDKILDKEARAIETGDVDAVIAAQEELAEINEKILKQQKEIVQENTNYISGLKYGLGVLEDRMAEYGSVVDTTGGYMKIHWDSYNALGDEAKETVDDLISEWEDYYDRLEEAKDAIQETIDYYHELAEEYRDAHQDARDTFIDLINDLADVLIQIDEEALDRQKEYYDQLIEQDENYLDALRRNVEERRRIRDRENAYEDLAEKQRRLSLLKRDTSGVYANEIASLEKEIENAQQDLTDQKIDDIIENMENDLTLRQEQFDRHIELMEDAIEQSKKNGEYAQKAQELLEQQPEEAYRILTEANSEYYAMSSAEQAQYVEEIKSQMIEMNRFMEGYYIRLAESMDAVAEAIRVDLANALAAMGQNSPNFNGSGIGSNAGPSNSGGSNGSNGGGNNGSDTGGYVDNNSDNVDDKATIKSVQQAINRLIDVYNSNMESLGLSEDSLKASRKEHIAVDGITGPKTRTAALTMYNWASSKGINSRETRLIMRHRDLIGFSDGGVVDFTGPAMVHGSKSKPEAFLDAEDTKNIAKLRDSLRQLGSSTKFTGTYENSNFRGGDCTIYITVEQIANDYDIDKAIEEVQRKILSSSSYRNINLINRMR